MPVGGGVWRSSETNVDKRRETIFLADVLCFIGNVSQQTLAASCQSRWPEIGWLVGDRRDRNYRNNNNTARSIRYRSCSPIRSVSTVECDQLSLSSGLR